MSERPGAVGRKTDPGVGTYEDLHDPAFGAKVPRCAICGMPNTASIVGPWDGDGKVYRIRVCDRCVARESKLNPDPLQVEEQFAT